jgi:cell division protein FtsZ
LNDNDIRGAKWILININSAEGETEFTMDEVETIQNHLLSQAGENSDVILGLGYDNSLEKKIGITLIATGFEHKEPFGKKEKPQEEEPVKKKDEKVVMFLEPEEKKVPVQPLFLFDEKADVVEETEKPTKTLNTQKQIKVLKDEDVADVLRREEKPDTEMAPTIVKDPQAEIVNLQPENDKFTVDKSVESNIYFTLSSAPEPTNAPIANSGQPKSVNVNPEIKKEFNKDASTVPSSGGYLAKPSQIYAEEKLKHESKAVDEPTPMQKRKQEDEPVTDMQLVVKQTHEAAEEEQEKKVHQTMPIMMSPVEEPPMVDEADELKRRAMDRIAKLRNLSFNVNAADPNNEFESVPAYLRRNMELHNSIADVESFYNNYTVKSDANNKAEIGTINSYLYGKKPD